MQEAHRRRHVAQDGGRCAAWLAPRECAAVRLTLVADGDARHLHARFGFVETAPASVNMEYRVGEYDPT